MRYTIPVPFGHHHPETVVGILDIPALVAVGVEILQGIVQMFEGEVAAVEIGAVFIEEHHVKVADPRLVGAGGFRLGAYVDLQLIGHAETDVQRHGSSFRITVLVTHRPERIPDAGKRCKEHQKGCYAWKESHF